ncbi:alpha-L-rhamnosidase C-terminal domain-containing protein [Paenibacillus sp. DMB20]|uniref:alpha-L-rhamnosidase C-terminal domain-containing protein n=1 Tax=Paenibacillus sp. DMB20 TaxID=1642570 RepID=UPI000627D9BD|nr:alpha-L-rhamnosidase C-terminal domain-containing protein [Paenibacillus sp. DMB20]KKO52627.1 hypothetical protein XI25_18380 [Paenibacillus sp. DMB20]
MKRAEPGWTRILVEPKPCGLIWARGSVPLPQGGRVDVSWSVEGNTMNVRVAAPGSVEVEVRVPEGMREFVTLAGNRAK